MFFPVQKDGKATGFYLSAKLNINPQNCTLLRLDLTTKNIDVLDYVIEDYSNNPTSDHYVAFAKKGEQGYALSFSQNDISAMTDTPIGFSFVFPFFINGSYGLDQIQANSEKDLYILTNETEINLVTFGEGIHFTNITITKEWNGEGLDDATYFIHSNNIYTFSRPVLYKPNIEFKTFKPTFHTLLSSVYYFGSLLDQNIYSIKNRRSPEVHYTTSKIITDFLSNEKEAFAVVGENMILRVSNKATVLDNSNTHRLLFIFGDNLVYESCTSTKCGIKRINYKSPTSEVLLVDFDGSDKETWRAIRSPQTNATDFTVLLAASSVPSKCVRFTVKPPVKCFGIDDELPNVCSSHGECVEENVCKCSGNWEGEKCDKCKAKFTGADCNEKIVDTCFKVRADSPNVCSGRGKCTAENVCVCNYLYSGGNCEFTTCFGVNQSHVGVCSGKGLCKDYNDCDCEDGYEGPNCEIYENTVQAERVMYPVMITFGVLSLVTVILLIMMVICFLGKHRKEHLAMYGTQQSGQFAILEEEEGEQLEVVDEDVEMNEPKNQTTNPPSTNPPNTTTVPHTSAGYSLGDSDEDLDL